MDEKHNEKRHVVTLTEQEVEFLVKLIGGLSPIVTGHFVQGLYNKLYDQVYVRGQFSTDEIMSMFRIDNDYMQGWNKGFSDAVPISYDKGYKEGYEDGVNDRT